ncbi:MAG: hypothetical protein ACTSWQ_00885 [Candidatus Thorarchaeota archaeon]
MTEKEKEESRELSRLYGEMRELVILPTWYDKEVTESILDRELTEEQWQDFKNFANRKWENEEANEIIQSLWDWYSA